MLAERAAPSIRLLARPPTAIKAPPIEEGCSRSALRPHRSSLLFKGTTMPPPSCSARASKAAKLWP